MLTDLSSYLFGIQDDLRELAGFCETLNDFVGYVGPQIDAKSKSGIHRLHQVAQLL